MKFEVARMEIEVGPKEGVTFPVAVRFRFEFMGASLIRNCPPPQDHRRTPDIGLLQGPRRRQILMSEVPM